MSGVTLKSRVKTCPHKQEFYCDRCKRLTGLHPYEKRKLEVARLAATRGVATNKELQRLVMSEGHVLDKIAEVLNEGEWSSDTAPAIAELVRTTGREVS